jgi:translation initiation factor 3 subunit J
MADDWEAWDDDAAPAVPPTAGAARLAALKQPDASAFAGEDEGGDEPADWEADAAAGAARAAAAAAKPAVNKYAAKDAAAARAAALAAAIDAGPLDDPAAEKARRQAAVEAADLAAAFELFGTGPAAPPPATAKEAEEYGKSLALKYVVPLSAAPHLKTVLKAFLRAALASADAALAKDIESTAAGVRAERVKAEAASAKAAAARGKKSKLNVGRSGGTAGLDDYQYSDGGGDDYDFM